MKYGLIFLVLLPTGPLFSQVPLSIPSDVELEFEESAYLIDFRQREGDEFPADFRAWKVYQAEKKVREHDFYYLAGYAEYAQEALRYRRWSRRMIWLSPIVFIGGVYVMAIGELGSALAGGGGGGGILGIAVMGGSVAMLVTGIVRMNRRWAPLGVAYPIAEEYNEALLRDLQD